jgi:hypothetical protein
MNPIDMADKLNEWLKKRIRFSFPIDRAARELTQQLDIFFKNHPFLKDPCLEITPPYESGASLQQLVDDGVLLQKTANVFAEVLAGSSPDNVRLYRHQDEAIREVRKNKSLVVSTGTGSGKTECFLIPIVDHLLRQAEAGELTNDVHVMMLYPMNALVNDQLARLREILKKIPEIRFGKYTGELASVRDEESIELEDSLIKDIKKHGQSQLASGLGFDRNLALPNEVTRRSEWREKPAHILVTNFSMLEYLLLRPEDSSLFGKKWRFVVLDEAHCYNGAMGTEISWLMRRLVNRVAGNGSRRDEMQYIATSATLVPDNGTAYDERASFVREQFASKIFPVEAEKVHYQEGSPCRYQESPDGVVWDDQAEDLLSRLNGAVIPEDWKRRSSALFGLEDDRSLFSWMKACAGKRAWIDNQNELKDSYKTLADGRSLGICDVDFLLHNLEAVLDLFKFESDLRVCGRETLDLLRRIVESGGSFNSSIWVDVLNDPLEPQKYEQTDAGRRRIGNKRRLAEDWVEGIDELSFESFHYLQKAAYYVLTNSDRFEMVELETLPVSLTDETRSMIDIYLERMTQWNAEIEDVTGNLISYWKELVPEVSFCEFSSVQHTVAGTISNHPVVLKLHTVLADALAGAKTGNGSLSLPHVAQSMGYDKEQLVPLLDWCCFAQFKGSRHPVLDLRYHQLARGLSGLTARFENGEVKSFCDLSALGEKGVFQVGVCRDCGQPYIVGYLEKVDHRYDANRRAMLSPYKTTELKYMVALSWKIFDIDPNDVENEERKEKVQKKL